MEGKKSHRERKNGASREEWQKRKAERNTKQREVMADVERAAFKRVAFAPITTESERLQDELEPII
jgi:hypothetical protein